MLDLLNGIKNQMGNESLAGLESTKYGVKVQMTGSFIDSLQQIDVKPPNSDS